MAKAKSIANANVSKSIGEESVHVVSSNGIRLGIIVSSATAARMLPTTCKKSVYISRFILSEFTLTLSFVQKKFLFAFGPLLLLLRYLIVCKR